MLLCTNPKKQAFIYYLRVVVSNLLPIRSSLLDSRLLIVRNAVRLVVAQERPILEQLRYRRCLPALGWASEAREPIGIEELDYATTAETRISKLEHLQNGVDSLWNRLEHGFSVVEIEPFRSTAAYWLDCRMPSLSLPCGLDSHGLHL
ncbi:hypothetical protein D3C81_1319640 [compost metagenome]